MHSSQITQISSLNSRLSILPGSDRECFQTVLYFFRFSNLSEVRGAVCERLSCDKTRQQPQLAAPRSPRRLNQEEEAVRSCKRRHAAIWMSVDAAIVAFSFYKWAKNSTEGFGTTCLYFTSRWLNTVQAKQAIKKNVIGLLECKIQKIARLPCVASPLQALPMGSVPDGYITQIVGGFRKQDGIKKKKKAKICRNHPSGPSWKDPFWLGVYGCTGFTMQVPSIFKYSPGRVYKVTTH